MKPKIFFCCFGPLALSFALLGCQNEKGDKDGLKIEFELLGERLYVGEEAGVKVKVTALTQDVSILTEWRSHQEGTLGVWLITPEGNRLGGGFGHPPGPRKAEDSRLLKRGESQTYAGSPGVTGRKPGAYELEVIFAPTGDRGSTITKRLPVTYEEIPANAIVDRSVIETTTTAPLGPIKQIIEIMNVKTSNGHEMLFRNTEPSALSFGEESPKSFAPSVSTRRVLSLDATSRIVAVPKYFAEMRGGAGQVWLVFNKGSDLHWARLTELGHVLQTGILGEGEFPFKKQGKPWEK